VSAGILVDISRIKIQVFFMQRFLAMPRLLTLMLLLAVSTISLTGCGNKGPLYLPQAPVQQISIPAEVSEEEASDETVDAEDSTDTPEGSPDGSSEKKEAAEAPETTEAD
jgi:predicted small lipoprotein YifL